MDGVACGEKSNRSSSARLLPQGRKKSFQIKQIFFVLTYNCHIIGTLIFH